MTLLQRHPDFAKLWAGQTISGFGSSITVVAMPASRSARCARLWVPNEVLGRVNSTLALRGVRRPAGGRRPGLGAGTAFGLRAALVAGSLTMLLAVTWAAASPLRSLRELPA